MALPDGRVLVDPSNVEIAQAIGATVDPEDHEFDLVIVGAGPAGLSAAVYGASEGLRTLVIDEGGIGGQATSSSLIRNYLGFPRGISGGQLAEQAYDQAWVFGAGFAFMQRASGIERSGDRLTLTLPGQPGVVRQGGAARAGRLVAPAGRSSARGAHGRRGLLRRPRLRGPGHGREGRLHRRRRELRRPGRPPPVALCAQRHPRGARAVARGRHVALPGAGAGGHPQRPPPAPDRGGRRRRRRPPPAPGAPRAGARSPRPWPPTACSC